MPSYWSQLLDELRGAKDKQDKHERLVKSMNTPPPDWRAMHKSLEREADKMHRGHRRERRARKAASIEGRREAISQVRQRALALYKSQAITAEELQRFEARLNRTVTDLDAKGIHL